MIRHKRLAAAVAAAALIVLGIGTTATATGTPGVEPASVAATLLPGQSTDVAKVVHTSTIPPNPDLVFLADTTGSMGSAIGNVQTNAINVMNSVLGAQPTSFFGAASYKDFDQGCGPDPYVYRTDQALTSSTGDVQTGINSWSAGGGCDTPEADLFALTQVANTFAWRPGSSRIIAWFGDAPSHDPSGGATLASTIAALQAQNIRVIAVNVGDLDGAGQASAIATQTDGLLLPANGDVSGAILSGLSNLPATVGFTVSCDPQLHVSLTPTSQTVPSGDDASFSETIAVDPSALAGTYGCTVSFTINGVPAGDAFNEAISITVPPPDLSIVKTGPAQTTEGNAVTYTLAATNNGPTTATGVTVSDPVPANTTYVSGSPGCTLGGGVVTCTAGTLAPGASQSFQLTFTAGSGNSIVNTATVGADQPDANPADNSSSVTTSVNHNPVCASASAGPSLWPPNHKLVWSSISGVTDQDGDPVAITITGIRQDEPTNGLGSGDTPIDGAIGTGNSFAVRAERSGTADGRVYHVSFSASDGVGGSCTGAATISVPHDQSGSAAVDGGPLYDSLS